MSPVSPMGRNSQSSGWAPTPCCGGTVRRSERAGGGESATACAYILAWERGALRVGNEVRRSHRAYSRDCPLAFCFDRSTATGWLSRFWLSASERPPPTHSNSY